jgi:hypothetical protein
MGLREVNMLLVEDNPLVVEAYEIGIRHIEEEEVEIVWKIRPLYLDGIWPFWI